MSQYFVKTSEKDHARQKVDFSDKMKVGGGNLKPDCIYR